MAEQRQMEEAITKFVEGLEEEQKIGKLLETKNSKELNDSEEYEEYEEFEEEQEKEVIEEDSQKEENLKNFVKNIIALVANSEVTEIKFEKSSGKIDIFGRDLGIAIGKNGKNMEAIEYIVNLYCKRKNIDVRSIIIDIKEYRKKKYDLLKNFAIKMAKKSIKEGRKIVLKPMPSYERKIIHDILSDSKEVKTKSKNKEPNRRIIIYPVKEKI